MRLCTFEVTFNQCEFFERDKGTCLAKKTNCGFCKEQEEKQSYRYERKPRWYEKYYK